MKKDLKLKLKEKKGNTCFVQDCKDSNLTFHHKIPKQEGGTDRDKNTLLVCRHHHDMIHGTDYMIKTIGVIPYDA